MRVLTVVGARPQFIKAAPVSRALRAAHEEILVHTGQHYDSALSDVFFEELGLPAPDVRLAVGSAAHCAQTGRMLEAIERVIEARRPDVLLVYGDTNSTLAGALAAAKRHLPVVHVEAGLRSGDRRMPEEINRVLTDHVSTLCCCPSPVAAAHLAREGITAGVHVVGDVMLDALLSTRARVLADQGPGRPGAPKGILFTLHRAAHTDDPAQLRRIIDAVGALEEPVRWPVHPRTRAALALHDVSMPAHVEACEPLGYHDLVRAVLASRVVLTDSGGLQKEAYWLGVPCVTLRGTTEWVETIDAGWNRLVDPEQPALADRLVAAVAEAVPPGDGPRDAYGAPGAASRIVALLEALVARPGVRDRAFDADAVPATAV